MHQQQVYTIKRSGRGARSAVLRLVVEIEAQQARNKQEQFAEVVDEKESESVKSLSHV